MRALLSFFALWAQEIVIPTSTFQEVQKMHLLPDDKAGVYLFSLSRRKVQDKTLSAPTYTRLFLHHVDSSYFPGWGIHGLCLSCDVNQDVIHYAFAHDKKNLYVAFSTLQETHLRVLDPEGYFVYQVRLPLLPNIQILPHPEKGIFYLWESPTQEEKIFYLQRFLPSYDTLPRIEITPRAGLYRKMRLVEGTLNGFIVTWESFQKPRRWMLYAQKFNWEGKPQWPVSGIALSELPGNIENPSLLSDGYGGFFCTYEVQSLRSSGKDLYLIRYGQSGHKVYEVPIAIEIDHQTNPKLYKRANELIVIWQDARSWDVNLYLQRLDIQNGKPRYQPNGIPITVASGRQKNPYALIDYFADQVVVLWEDERHYHEDLYWQKMSAEGQNLWEFSGRRLIQRPYNQRIGDVAPTGQTFWVAYWEENPTYGNQPYLLHLRSDGQMLQEIPLFLKGDRSLTTFKDFSVAGPYLITLENREGTDQLYLYADFLPQEGIPLSPQPTWHQRMPVWHKQGDTLWLLWGAEEMEIEEDLFAQAILPPFKKLFPKSLPVCIADRIQNEPRLLRLHNALYAFWTDTRAMEESAFDLYMRKIFPSHLPEIALRFGKGIQTSLQTFPISDSLAHFLWSEEMQQRLQVFYGLMGEELRKVGPIRPSVYPQRFATALADTFGNLYVAFCEEAPSPYQQKIRLLALSPDGHLLWQKENPFPQKHQLYPHLRPFDARSNLLMALTQENKGYSLSILHFDREGNPLAQAHWLNNLPETTRYELTVHQGKLYLLVKSTAYEVYTGTPTANPLRVKSYPDATKMHLLPGAKIGRIEKNTRLILETLPFP
ncbi:MAG: hypothetical protein ACUVRD_02260 [Bacteroidia bacterium]